MIDLDAIKLSCVRRNDMMLQIKNLEVSESEALAPLVAAWVKTDTFKESDESQDICYHESSRGNTHVLQTWDDGGITVFVRCSHGDRDTTRIPMAFIKDPEGQLERERIVTEEREARQVEEWRERRRRQFETLKAEFEPQE